jgi:hypothetical protein
MHLGKLPRETPQAHKYPVRSNWLGHRNQAAPREGTAPGCQ